MYLDGGLVANTPVQLALHEAHRLFGANTHLISLLSLGTGQFKPHAYSYDPRKTLRAIMQNEDKVCNNLGTQAHNPVIS